MPAIKVEFAYLSEEEIAEIKDKLLAAAYEIAEQMNIPPPTISVDPERII